MDRKRFIAAALATPLLSGGTLGDAVRETHDVALGPTDLLCFVVDPSLRLSDDEVRRIRDVLSATAPKWSIDPARILVTHGIRPTVIRNVGGST